MERAVGLTSQVCELAVQAGKRIMDIYHNGAAVTWKEDASPLTAADQASHEFLVNSLPLDGTKEFVKRTNEFTVNVALMQARLPILDVVHAPALNLTYYGGRNFGAWRQADDESSTPISTRRAGTFQLGVVASKDHAGPLISVMLARLTNPRLQSMGSSLKF